MECILILTQIRLALVFFVIHKDIGSLFGVLGWKKIERLNLAILSFG